MSTFVTGTDDHVVNDIVLSAQNYSEHHGQHIRMAKNNCTDDNWYMHLVQRIIPTWRRNGSTDTLSHAQKSEAACLLREYYNNYITEL